MTDTLHIASSPVRRMLGFAIENDEGDCVAVADSTERAVSIVKAVNGYEPLCSLIREWAAAEGDDTYELMDQIVAAVQ